MILGEVFAPVTEGVYDKSIFKAVFMAGGPGSGKTYIADKLFGGTALRHVNIDHFVEMLLGYHKKDAPPAQGFLNWNNPEIHGLHQRARGLNMKRRDLYLEGRIGLIIDGTGRDYAKITNMANRLKQEFGYDVAMVFVQTDLETALRRNAARRRRVDPDEVQRYHEQVNANLDKFENYFGENFVVVENTIEGPRLRDAWRKMQAFLTKPPTSHHARVWIAAEKAKRNRAVATTEAAGNPTPLDRHQIIALDMDGTLVPDGKTPIPPIKHKMLHQYIKDHQEKKYIVVTFRDPEWARQIPAELRAAGLDPKFVDHILHCPQELWAAHQQVTRMQGGKGTKQQMEMAQAYIEWKGLVCQKANATILVDDKIEHVAQGCKRYGVDLLDIRDLDYPLDDASA